MRASPFIVALAAGTALALSLPALGQDPPESLLPEGFGDPAPPPPPQPPSPSGPTPDGPAPEAPDPSRPAPSPDAPRDDREFVEEVADGEEEVDPFKLLTGDYGEIPLEYELPAGIRRPLTLVGPLTPELGGYGEDAFGDADGRWLETLMRRLDPPGPPSRWLHIVLRRALLSSVPTPSRVSAPDWIAERAWLLLRIGEADGARLLVQRVDSNRYTPKLYAVAMQTALANSDPAAFCPLLGGARAVSDAAAWVLAQAICDGLEGESATATAQMDIARSRSITNELDILLAARAVGAGATGRSAPFEWEGVGRLSAWRFGIANAVGLAIPEELYARAGPQVAGWRARTPNIAIADRIAPARKAAVLGVFSNEILVDLYSARYPELPPEELSGSAPARLRSAYVRAAMGERVAAMRALWDESEEPDDLYAALILTARAAALVAPSADHASDAGDLIAAMLAGGRDRDAARWAALLGEMETGQADRAWALLAVGAPQGTVATDLDRVDDYAGRAGAAGRHRARMLAAGLAGLGRLSGGETAEAADSYGFSTEANDEWTRQLERAARRRERGTVALLAAVGMQAQSWHGIPPRQLYHVVRALRAVGLDGEARMIAAEAVTRL